MRQAVEEVKTSELSSDNIKRLEEQIQQAQSFHVSLLKIDEANAAFALAKQQFEMVHHKTKRSGKTQC